MKLGTVTRGDHKIYIQLTAQCPKEGSVVATSRTKAGDEVPALVVAKDSERDEYVLVIPLLHADQTVDVRVLDGAGACIDSLSRDIRYFSSALKSKYNTFSKASGIDDIRNIDRFVRSDASTAYLYLAANLDYNSNAHELVRIRVTAPCIGEEAKQAGYSISVLDRHGKRIPVKNLLVVSDRLDCPVAFSPFCERVLDVSFQIDRSYEGFVFYMEFDGGALPPVLYSADKHTIRQKREAFDALLTDTAAGPSYEKWFFEKQRAFPAELDAQREAVFDVNPSFSIIVPLYRTPLTFFHDMVQSVLQQTYSNFELVLVNASPDDEGLQAAISDYLEMDDRVKVISLERNLGIAGNTNEGIRAAKGDFLCFLDHDDLIEPNLLFEYTCAINRYPETDLLYCDEDKLCDGHFTGGFVKPDFSWDLLTAYNYVCHMLAVRASIVDEVELSSDEVSGAQDWDLTMKVAEKARIIYHVPRVLYHWRIHEESTASGDPSAKPYTHKAGERAILGHFDRIGIPVRVYDTDIDNIHRIEYDLPEQEPLVSIIIPNKDQSMMLERLLDSIRSKSTYKNYEVIIVENNSVESDTFAYYERVQEECPNVRVVDFDGSFNYSAVCNYGARQALGSYFLFLNNDMEVITPDWIEKLLGPLQREDVGIVGAQLLFPDDTIQHTGVILNDAGPTHVLYGAPKDYPSYFGICRKARDVIAVTGACLMIGRDDFETIEGFDESFVVEYNDVDFCLRLRETGKRVVIEPQAELYHFESVSRGVSLSPEKKRRRAEELTRFLNIWRPRYVDGDPWYGRSISRGSAFYALEWGLRG